MSSQVPLSCPFCHHKSVYTDAPVGSTVRCNGCKEVFRVPKKQKIGRVAKGEHVKSGSGGLGKVIAWLIVLGILGVGGWYGYKYVTKKPPEFTKDWYSDSPGYNAKYKAEYEEDTGLGKVERVLLSWKAEKLERVTRYLCLTDQMSIQKSLAEDSDFSFKDKLWEVLGRVELKTYSIVRATGKPRDGRIDYEVTVSGIDTRTKVDKRGKMSVRVLVELDEEGKEVWGVKYSSLAPAWGG